MMSSVSSAKSAAEASVTKLVAMLIQQSVKTQTPWVVCRRICLDVGAGDLTGQLHADQTLGPCLPHLQKGHVGQWRATGMVSG